MPTTYSESDIREAALLAMLENPDRASEIAEMVGDPDALAELVGEPSDDDADESDTALEGDVAESLLEALQDDEPDDVRAARELLEEWTAAKSRGKGGIKAVWSGAGERKPLYGDAAKRVLAKGGANAEEVAADKPADAEKKPAKVSAKETKAQAAAKAQEALKAVADGKPLSAEHVDALANGLLHLTGAQIKAARQQLGGKGAGGKNKAEQAESLRRLAAKSALDDGGTSGRDPAIVPSADDAATLAAARETSKAAKVANTPPSRTPLQNVRVTDIDTPHQSSLLAARNRKQAAKAKVDQLRQKIKDEPIGKATDVDPARSLDSHTPKNSSWSVRGVELSDIQKRPAGFRIHDGRKALPSRSTNHWTGQEGETLPGTSSYANFHNAVADMLLGETESVTGENYTSNITQDGGEPELWVLVSDKRAKDMPGAELLVPDARPSMKFTKSQVEDAFREALAEDDGFSSSDLQKPLHELADEYELNDLSYFDRTQQILQKKATEAWAYANPEKRKGNEVSPLTKAGVTVSAQQSADDAVTLATARETSKAARAAKTDSRVAKMPLQ